MPEPIRLAECATRIRIDCPRCGRHGDYMRQRLERRFGADIEVTDLLFRIAACDRAPKGQCEARFDLDSLPSPDRVPFPRQHRREPLNNGKR